jgi:adenosine deaminase CECR1
LAAELLTQSIAMVDFDYLFQVVLDTPGMHISSPDTHLATAEAREEADVSIRFKEKPQTKGSIWHEGYKPGTPILLTKAADSFPHGGRPGFLKWLRSRCTISQTDAVEQHHGVDAIWRKFAGCFRVTGAMLHYEPIWRRFLRRMMSLIYADGIRWVELR